MNLNIERLNWLKTRSEIYKRFGARYPFALQGDTEANFYGVVAFELKFEDIEGFDCSNSLIINYSKVAFEANKLTKFNF